MALSQHERLERACAELTPPFACVDLDAFDANGGDLVRRAAGTSLRLATKSVRCRALQRRVLDGTPGFRGVLTLTLTEALWLAGHGFDDLVVGYPTADRAALARLVSVQAPITVMTDAIEHLDLIAATGATAERPVRVCIELDAGLRLLRGRVRIGAKRSPLHEPGELAAFAAEVLRRPELRLVGVMAYESQIAGVGDSPPGRRLGATLIRAMQAASARELRERRAAAVARVEELAGPLEFVNGGGTGSVESSAREAAVTEVAAGSGLFAPTLFDGYRAFTPRPAAFFAIPIVRRPSPGIVTALGGGYVASGAPGRDRLPQPVHPPGLRLDPREGAGEAQTPLVGTAAGKLRIGDRVWMRHAKAGELCERFTSLFLVRGERIVDEVPTYRGEGCCFL
jgi:D-serine deaminase-like pyridoxal phosphate-dependent protein